MSDCESLSSHAGLRNELKVSPSMPLLPASSSLSPATVCLDSNAKTKAKPTRPESTATILSDLEIFDSPTYAFTTSDEQPSDNQKEDEVDDDDDVSPSTSTRTSVSTPTTPRQYGIGRQVLSGSGSGRDFDFIGSSSKRLSASTKRDSIGLEKRGSRLSFVPVAESTLDSKAEKTGNVEQQLDNPSSAAAEESSEADQDHLSTQFQTRTQISKRRRVKSDVSNRKAGTNVSRRSTTTYHEKKRDSNHPEWTLFLGIPRNAAPPPTPPAPSVLFSAREPNADLASIITTTPARTITQRHSLLSTHFLTPTMTMRNRTRSDSALLLSASGSALPPGVTAAAEEHDDGGGKRSKVTKNTKRGEEDWTLSLPLVVSPTTPSSVSPVEVLRGSKQHSDAPSGSQPSVVVEDGEERQPRVVGEVDTTKDLVITVENEEEKEEEKRDQDPLILRVPRIVRSCSSYPILSTASASPTHNIHSRLKKSSSTKWMGMETTTSSSTPKLRRGVSSCTLEEEVMSMLLDDAVEEEDGDESQLKLKSKSSTTTIATTKKDLEKKKMATLDEDLARFNALLKNGNMNGPASRPVSLIIENAVAAAAAAAASAAAAAAVTATTTASATPTLPKTKTVTLNSHPESIPTTTPNSTLPPSLRKKNKTSSSSLRTTSILKPALKHVKSCEPFLLLEKSSLEKSSSSDGSSGPVMRFPSSAGRGDLNFFDELGRGGGHRGGDIKRGRASLRLTKSAEWVMGNDDDAHALRLPPPPPVPTTITNTTKSRPTSSSSRVSQQQQQRTTTTMSRPTSASSRMPQHQQQRTTTTMSRPTSASSRMSQQQQQRTTTTLSRPTSASSRMSQQQQQQRTTTTMSRPTSASSRMSQQQQQQRTTSRPGSPLSTSTTQTSLLPFANYNTKFASSSSSSSASTRTTTTNLKSKGSLGRFEMSSRRGGVPTMPFRAVSMGSMNCGTNTTTPTITTTAPVEPTSGNFSFSI